MFLHSKYPDAIRTVDPKYKRLPLHWSVTAGDSLLMGCSVDVTKMLFDLFPAALGFRDVEGSLPLHILVRGLPRDVPITENKMDQLRFLLKHYHAAVATADTEGKSPYSLATERALPILIRRRLLRAAPVADLKEYKRLNYIERRGAMYLLFAAHLPSDNTGVAVWKRLRQRGCQQLMEDILSFL
jgi:hypothetical protein